MEKLRRTLFQGVRSNLGFRVKLLGRSEIAYQSRVCSVVFEGELYANGSWAIYSNRYRVISGVIPSLEAVVEDISRVFDFLGRELEVH